MPQKRSNRARSIRLNQHTYDFPQRPLVAICVDGCDPAYIKQGLSDGILPRIQRFLHSGFGAWADAAMPTFTNPNNLSIVTGSPPAVHGIAGNYFLDPKNGQAVMMTDPAQLRSDTLLARFSQAGAQVVVITAKDKLCRLLGHGLRQGICFSAEKAAGCTYEQHGIENVCDQIGLPQPQVYSAELSLFVLEAGLALLEQHQPDLMYLSLSDYVQHKHAPGSTEANAFYQALDCLCGRFADAGAVVALTADHGMNAKPQIVFLQDILDGHFSTGKTRVICPITDPYVVHHGALGSFVRVYCPGMDQMDQTAVSTLIRSIPGIEAVY
ncbi:MAG: phosphonoacetate hydrolase, partial [Lysobacterales bacterium]